MRADTFCQNLSQRLFSSLSVLNRSQSLSLCSILLLTLTQLLSESLLSSLDNTTLLLGTLTKHTCQLFLSRTTHWFLGCGRSPTLWSHPS